MQKRTIPWRVAHVLWGATPSPSGTPSVSKARPRGKKVPGDAGQLCVCPAALALGDNSSLIPWGSGWICLGPESPLTFTYGDGRVTHTVLLGVEPGS